MASSKEEGAGVAPQNRGSWTTFLKSIASFNGDLSSLTAPAFILGTTSLTEFSSYWAEHPGVFVAPAAEKDPAKRALLVLKWFLSTLRQQYCSRADAFGSEKKPLNPFLGELFLGEWVDSAGTTKLISEQVSHHPPVTAYNISNEQHGVRLQGYNGQKASFSRTIHVKQVGHALYHIDGFDEDHFITLPSLHIEGLIYGSPFVELDKTTAIVSSSGYISKIDYSGRGWISGKKNTFSATLSAIGEKDPLYSVEGHWNESFTIREGGGKKGKVLETWNSGDQPTTKLQVAPIAEQDPRESNRAWKLVADAIVKGDMETTSREKSKIENAQRELRKKEQAEGTEWPRTFFSKRDGPEDNIVKLAKTAAEPIEPDKTGGVWRFHRKKAEAATKPYDSAFSEL